MLIAADIFCETRLTKGEAAYGGFVHHKRWVEDWGISQIEDGRYPTLLTDLGDNERPKSDFAQASLRKWRDNNPQNDRILDSLTVGGTRIKALRADVELRLLEWWHFVGEFNKADMEWRRPCHDDVLLDRVRGHYHSDKLDVWAMLPDSHTSYINANWNDTLCKLFAPQLVVDIKGQIAYTAERRLKSTLIKPGDGGEQAPVVWLRSVMATTLPAFLYAHRDNFTARYLLKIWQTFPVVYGRNNRNSTHKRHHLEQQVAQRRRDETEYAQRHLDALHNDATFSTWSKDTSPPWSKDRSSKHDTSPPWSKDRRNCG